MVEDFTRLTLMVLVLRSSRHSSRLIPGLVEILNNNKLSNKQHQAYMVILLNNKHRHRHHFAKLKQNGWNVLWVNISALNVVIALTTEATPLNCRFILSHKCRSKKLYKENDRWKVQQKDQRKLLVVSARKKQKISEDNLIITFYRSLYLIIKLFN